ncbi:MAG: hypothetical protein DRP71_08795 [Verrucomicrobia bacterium]|nr:MAG: hypothetical protein DRP71_08795 [Verrucomicrobiota bacterium]
MGDVTYDLELLSRSRSKWEGSSGVRAVYRAIFEAAMGFSTSGRVLEIGSGAGFLKEVYPEVVTSDIALTPYVEREVSAYEIEKSIERWGTIIAMDVLHHLREPLRFFESASASLTEGGRLILIEPAGTVMGRAFYRLFHQEPCRPDRLRDPYRFEADDEEGNFANMGMGWALFHRDREEINRRLAAMRLKVVAIRYRDVLAYPATGGLSRRQLLPTSLLRVLLRIERVLPQWALARIGLRMIIVLESVRDQ